jgi:hypothetical protein
MRPQVQIFMQPCNSITRFKYCNALFSSVCHFESAPEMTLPGGAGHFCMIGHENTDTPELCSSFILQGQTLVKFCISRN